MGQVPGFGLVPGRSGRSGFIAPCVKCVGRVSPSSRHGARALTHRYNIYIYLYAYIAFVRDRFGPRVCLNALNSLLFKHRLTENV